MEVVKPDATVAPTTYKHKHRVQLSWERPATEVDGQTMHQTVKESVTIIHEHEPMDNRHYHQAQVMDMEV